MSAKTITFLVVLGFLVGIVLGFSISKQPDTCIKHNIIKQVVYDTIINVKNDTIRIPVDRVKYFTKIDTLIINDTFEYDDTPKLLKCVSFPLILSDSSKIEVTECSKDSIPQNITFDAKYIEKREKLRIVETTRVDTVMHSAKRLGFSIGPSAGIGIDINDIKRPVYFIGATLTYGWRF